MFDRRLGLLYFVFCAVLLCIGARLFQLQVLGLTSEDPDAVLRRPLPLEEVPAARGTIFDRDGDGPRLRPAHAGAHPPVR